MPAQLSPCQTFAAMLNRRYYLKAYIELAARSASAALCAGSVLKKRDGVVRALSLKAWNPISSTEIRHY